MTAPRIADEKRKSQHFDRAHALLLLEEEKRKGNRSFNPKKGIIKIMNTSHVHADR